ncbi:hypothetical protein BXZ70DRAFT_110008 [Cristinia sonorae]|uniref:WW domain-containing protein n=1 Tax=Cristinia sonorae TaxID=1940300 RepID=A0A8K0UQ85_9AGAR|nr:hypothetical protein BXZ70DRAFT_110008 [Cristinia sonorae]
MPSTLTLTGQLRDLLRHLYQLTNPRSILRRLLHVWTILKLRFSRKRGGGGGMGYGEIRNEEDAVDSGAKKLQGTLMFAASRAHGLVGRSISPSSRDEFVDAPSRPLSFQDPIPGPQQTSFHGPSRPQSMLHYNHNNTQGNLLTPYSHGTPTASIYSHDHRGRSPEPTHAPVSYGRTAQRRSRSPHVSTGIATRRSPSKGSSLRSHRRHSRVSIVNAAHHSEHVEESPLRASSILPPSTEYSINVRSSTNSGNTPTQLPTPLNISLIPYHTIERYDRGIILPKQPDDYECIIPKMTLHFPRQGIPRGWIACSHPEGALYYFDESRRIYTEADIIRPGIHQEVEECVKQLKRTIDSERFDLPPNSSLVIEPSRMDVGDDYYYYYVDHDNRTLFWLEDYELRVHELDGMPFFTQLRHELEVYYWAHVFSLLQRSTSPSSTVLYSVDDLQKMLSCAKHAKRAGETDYATAIIARLHKTFAHPRFLNYHGELGARLERDQSVHGTSKYPRSTLIRLLAPMLFNAPYVHLHTLERIYVDGTMCHLPWAIFIEKLKDEWQEFTLFATVLLNANVAFLAIPSVDLGPDVRSPPQIISYISVIAGVGCIIIGLLLVRQYRVKPRDTVDEAAKFLHSKTHPTRGVETLAILYSLPYALLMWSMVTFLAAFSYECFIVQDLVAIWTTAGAWIVICLLIIWCIYSAWESKDDVWYKRTMSLYKEKIHKFHEHSRTLIHQHFSFLFPSSTLANGPTV